MRKQLIANDGQVRWVADGPDAGPYHLMWSCFSVVRSFGVRSLTSSRAGSHSQRAAFEQSKAAFEALRVIGAGEFAGDQGRSAIHVAAEAARIEWRRMGHELWYYHDAAERYRRAVLERVCRKMGY